MTNEYEEALENVRRDINIHNNAADDFKYLGIIEKALKALDIIIKKNIDTTFLKGCLTLSEYNSSVASLNDLSQDEYDLLKEVLEKWVNIS